MATGINNKLREIFQRLLLKEVKMKGNSTKSKAVAGGPLKNAIAVIDLQEKIGKKAYELYEKKGCAHGNDLADWFEAERIVLSEKKAPKRRGTIAAKRFTI